MHHPRVLVIYNEPVLPTDHPDAAAEHDIIEATSIVVQILRDAGFPIRELGFSYEPRKLLDELRDHPPDVVFNMFEGLGTQTATEISVVGLLEWLNVPCTGSPSHALAIGRDKIRTKYLLRGAGVPTAEFQVIEQLPVPPWTQQWPAIVKPGYQDCSVGIDQASVVTNQGDLERRVACMLDRYGPPVLVEEFISGRELHVNLFAELVNDSHRTRLRCIPFSEIRFVYQPGQDFWPIYSYDAKWNTQTDEFRGTPIDTVVELAPALRDQVRRVAEQAFELIGLRDCGRIDLRLTEDGRPYVLEVNPNPYLHSESIVDGLKAIGLSHPLFIEGMVWCAFARRNSPV